MKVLMFGWEFPPVASGGLGTACYGLAKGLKTHGVDLTFVMPHMPEGTTSDRAQLIGAHMPLEKLDKKAYSKYISEVVKIPSLLTPYMTYEEYLDRKATYGTIVDEIAEFHDAKTSGGSIYGKDLFQEVYRYRQRSRLIALTRDFDVIHCHDWMTYGAGIEAKKATGKPLVVHIHATEFDRTGNNPNQYVYDLEREGFHHADRILAVSNFTRSRLINHYGVPPEKVEVVHNAVEFNDEVEEEQHTLSSDDKIILFLGRITIQKGPDWFLYAAKMVADHYPNVKFVVAGSGDMEAFMINKAAEFGLAEKMLFTGFLRGKDIDRAYRMADLYVMPSISEPFGITPLEAMRNGTPTLISHQSGVSEVLSNCLKADFWDVHDMANKMIAALHYTDMHEQLKDHGKKEVYKFNWDEPARKCVNAYRQVLESATVTNKGGTQW